MLTFDPIAHAYTWNGQPVPGVTTVLKPLYDFSGINPSVLAAKAALGTAVHACTELFDQGILDMETVREEWAGYLLGWQAFLAESGFEVIPRFIESRVFHPVHMYAGTMDRAGRLNGRLTILDIKTAASMSNAIGVQTAAYAEAFKASHPEFKEEPIGRAAVQLRPDGTYRLHTYHDPADWPVFLSLKTIHTWKAKNGVSQ